MPMEDKFHDAIRANDRVALEAMLKKNVDINCVYYGMTPLHVAIAKDHVDLAVWLIGQGADINNSGVNMTTTPFEEAVVRDQVQVVKTLAKRGVDLNQRLTSGHTALTWAALKNLTYLSQTLVEAGADVNLRNTQGETALWLSARAGHAGVVEQLLCAHAETDQACGDQMLTPLHCSVASEHLNTTKLIIKNGCDLNKRDSGNWTALWHAVTNSNEDLVRALLSAGADPSVADADGRTLQQEAADNEDEDILRVLQAT